MVLNQKKATAKVWLLSKRVGETPLEALNRLRLIKPTLQKTKLTYAGRLDPLASGLLLVLSGEDCKLKDNYLGLTKTYEVEILFGVATDSHDLLGKITETKLIKPGEVRELKKNLKTLLPSLVGKSYQEYPQYSTPKIAGKKQFGKEIEILMVEEKEWRKITASKLATIVPKRINLVTGDFRQPAIIKKWTNFLRKNSDQTFYGVKLKIKATAGTYVRLLAHNLGKDLKVPALAYSIHRTAVGRYHLDNKRVIK